MKTGAFGQFSNVFPMGGRDLYCPCDKGHPAKKKFPHNCSVLQIHESLHPRKFPAKRYISAFKKKKKEVFSTFWENVRMVMAW